MNFDDIKKYAPWVLVMFGVCMQYNLFVTPKQLGDTKAEILQEVSKNYATKEQNTDLKNQLNDMQHKIDRIYDVLITNK